MSAIDKLRVLADSPRTTGYWAPPSEEHAEAILLAYAANYGLDAIVDVLHEDGLVVGRKGLKAWLISQGVEIRKRTGANDD